MPDTRLDPVRALFVPGERLGWVFRDRNFLRREFPEPPPTFTEQPREPVKRTLKSVVVLVKRVLLTIGATLLGLAVVGLLGALGFWGTRSGTVADLTVLAGLLVVVFLVYAHIRPSWFADLGRAGARAAHRRRYAEWERRKADFDRAEQERGAGMAEWGVATPAPSTRRIDIVGGNLWGWEGFLTVFGGSMLSTHGPLTLVDLTGEAVGRELLELATAAGLTTDVQVLPEGLATSDLLVGLGPAQFVDVLVESLYGDADTAHRADRMMDDRILTDVCAALGDRVGVARVAAALRVLMGEPGEHGALSEPEQRRIADDLFSDEYRRQAHSNLRRIEAFLRPLEPLGVAAERRPAVQLTCLATVTTGRSARTELLDDLVVQWLTRRVSGTAATVRTLVIAGADELQRRHIERLSDVCERREVRLVFLFRHLREASLEVLGGGEVGFMRLGNHEEAMRAADFIGRHHTFVLSELTQTLGGNETHTTGTAEGQSTGEGATREFAHIFRQSSQWNRSRNWGASQSAATGSSWTVASSRQRVYEHTVEPRTLQDLPDYAMLLVQSRPGGPVLAAVDCNPDIVTLPQTTMEPLPPASSAPGADATGQVHVPVSGFPYYRRAEDPDDPPPRR